MAGVGPGKAKRLGRTGLWLACHRSPDISASPLPPGIGECSAQWGEASAVALKEWGSHPGVSRGLAAADPGLEERAHLPSGVLGEAGSPGAPPVPQGRSTGMFLSQCLPEHPEAPPGGKHHFCGLLHGPSSGPPSVGNSDCEARDPRSLGKERPAGGGHVGGLTAVLSFLFPPMSSCP